MWNYELGKHAAEREPTHTRGEIVKETATTKPAPSSGWQAMLSSQLPSCAGDREIHQLPSYTASSIKTSRSSQPASAAPSNGAIVSHTETVAAPVKVKKKRIRIKTERRREQCRINQARYRNKQRSSALNLEDTVVQLQLQVHQLETKRRSLAFSVNTRSSATRVAMEYCRLFRNGMAVTTPPPGVNLPTLEQQIRFVIAAFHPDARVGDSYGCECFLEQSRRFSTYYDGLRILPLAFIPITMADAKMTIKVRVILQLTITETTIRYVYPHLQQPQYTKIKWKLLGQRIDCVAGLEFLFDEDGKAEAVEWTIDFVGALQPYLTINEVAIVVQQAQVVRDAYLLQSDEEAAGEKLYMERVDDEDEGFLIHDGKGDDYVMV